MLKSLTLKTSQMQILMREKDDFVVKEYENGWEKFSLELWENELFKLDLGATVWDVGAYTGIYSLVGARLRPDCRIKAFEPFPDIAVRLLYNISANHFFNIECRQYALSDADTITELHVTGASPLPSGSSIDPHPSKSDVRTLSITTKSADDILAADSFTSAPALIKIDVEMAEIKVLHGMRNLLNVMKPTVLIELLTEQSYRDAVDILKNCGYSSINRINDARCTLDGDIPPSANATNYIIK